ncbi:MAG: type II toxin-antitoxin system RelB/DinJ family antitoxin [Lactobacillus sp.]|jgi:DNA-damage-inducible protein J|nr:type II toxin-antitoxin system RelB/DinJ family antitoxin [Lactobacillus sp.]
MASQKDTRLSIRINSALKQAGQAVAKNMGLDLSSAVTMFITQMVKDQGLPFKPTSLPVETLQAFKEADHPEKRQHYPTPTAMWQDIL